MPEALYNLYLWDYNKPDMLQHPIVIKYLSQEVAEETLDAYWKKGETWDGFIVLASEDENDE